MNNVFDLSEKLLANKNKPKNTLAKTDVVYVDFKAKQITKTITEQGEWMEVVYESDDTFPVSF